MKNHEILQHSSETQVGLHVNQKILCKQMSIKAIS